MILAQCPLLGVKRSFVRPISDTQPLMSAFLQSGRSINQMSHAMGLETIAEYVENRAIKTQLCSLGVDYGQGFGIEKTKLLADLLSSSSAGIKRIREAKRR